MLFPKPFIFKTCKYRNLHMFYPIELLLNFILYINVLTFCNSLFALFVTASHAHCNDLHYVQLVILKIT